MRLATTSLTKPTHAECDSRSSMAERDPSTRASRLRCRISRQEVPRLVPKPKKQVRRSFDGAADHRLALLIKTTATPLEEKKPTAQWQNATPPTRHKKQRISFVYRKEGKECASGRWTGRVEFKRDQRKQTESQNYEKIHMYVCTWEKLKL
jgi:hypothetical protein